ncbi:MAG: outer membrane beta-barrel protein [Hydrogenobaculum sp.]
MKNFKTYKRFFMALTILSLPLSFGGAYAFQIDEGAFGKLNIDGAVSGYYLYSNNVPPASTGSSTNGDKKNRYDISNALVNISKPDGVVRFTIVAGAYAFPTVGETTAKTTQSGYNTDLFSALPIAYLEFDPNQSVSIKVGKLPTMIGYESAFTYQNIDIQRSILWSMQPVVSRGIRFTYTKDIFTGNLELNDGFYSEKKPALEGSFSLAPNQNASISFNFIYPDKNTKPNQTSNPANKQEYELTGSYTISKFTFAFDSMYVHVPTSTEGETTSNHAFGIAGYATYNINDAWSLNARAEYGEEGTSGTDIMGFGLVGAHAYSITITPEYKYKQFFIRPEVSYVHITNVASAYYYTSPTASTPTKNTQIRLGLEAGFVF